jgi:hypothetical protein
MKNGKFFNMIITHTHTYTFYACELVEIYYLDIPECLGLEVFI